MIDTVPETEVWTRQHKSVWGGEPQPVIAAFERISGAAAHGMTTGQELLLLDFMDCYYQSVCNLQVIDPAVLCTNHDQSAYHRTVWRTRPFGGWRLSTSTPSRTAIPCAARS